MVGVDLLLADPGEEPLVPFQLGVQEGQDGATIGSLAPNGFHEAAAGALHVFGLTHPGGRGHALLGQVPAFRRVPGGRQHRGQQTRHPLQAAYRLGLERMHFAAPDDGHRHELAGVEERDEAGVPDSGPVEHLLFRVMGLFADGGDQLRVALGDDQRRAGSGGRNQRLGKRGRPGIGGGDAKAGSVGERQREGDAVAGSHPENLGSQETVRILQLTVS